MLITSVLGTLRVWFGKLQIPSALPQNCAIGMPGKQKRWRGRRAAGRTLGWILPPHGQTASEESWCSG